MQEYLNKPCGECGEKFTEKDEISVCPDCGTPIHRSCWTGHCPNEEKHGSFDWEKDNGIAKEEPVNKSVCGICGEPLSERTVYCQDCGTPMHLGCFMRKGQCPNIDKHDGEPVSAEGFQREDSFSAPPVFINSYDSFAEKVRKNPVRDRTTGEPLTCYGVTQNELVYFLGQHHISTPRYMGIFIRMAMTGKKAFFNLWQGLLMPFYQFYQKMFGPAIILTLLTFILDIPALMWNAQILEAGSSSEPVLSESLSDIINICAFVSLGAQVLFAFFGDYIYMKWTVSRILTLREKYKDLPEMQYYEILEKKGNPRWYFTLIGLAISFILTYILTYFIF